MLVAGLLCSYLLQSKLELFELGTVKDKKTDIINNSRFTAIQLFSTYRLTLQGLKLSHSKEIITKNGK